VGIYRQEQREALRIELLRAQTACSRAGDLAGELGYQRVEDELCDMLLALGTCFSRLESGQVHQPLPGQARLPF
jgi:hypothetical protein